MLKIGQNWGKIANYPPQCSTKICTPDGTTGGKSHPVFGYGTENSIRINHAINLLLKILLKQLHKYLSVTPAFSSTIISLRDFSGFLEGFNKGMTLLQMRELREPQGE